MSKAKAEIKYLIDEAEVKKVPPKTQGKRGKKDVVKPLSGLDIDALLGESRPRTSISPENSIPEFKQALASAADEEEVENAVKQMGDIIRKLIRDSFADLLYSRAAENLRVLREELIGLEMPDMYNKFITALKKSLLSGELNGERKDMWRKHIVAGHLTLISKEESEVSEVTEAEADAVSLFAIACHLVNKS